MTLRRFGVEAEFFNLSRGSAVEALRAVGVRAENDGYHHETRDYWRVTSDGSVNGSGTGDGSGNELVSPILMPATALEVDSALGALRAAGADIDQSCGVHVHHDAGNLTVEDVLRTLEVYARATPTIDTLVAPSRRSDNYPNYCRPITLTEVERTRRYVNDYGDVGAGAVDAAVRGLALRRYMSSGRYMTVNTEALEDHGTLEFRQHGASLLGPKVRGWARFTALIAQVGPRTRKSWPVSNGVAVTDLETAGLDGLLTFLGAPADLRQFARKRAMQLSGHPKARQDADGSEDGQAEKRMMAYGYDEDDQWCPCGDGCADGECPSCGDLMTAAPEDAAVAVPAGLQEPRSAMGFREAGEAFQLLEGRAATYEETVSYINAYCPCDEHRRARGEV